MTSGAFKLVSRGVGRAALVVLVWLVGLMATTLRADTVYVVDRLQLGIHDDISIDSTIVAIVPSGTELTVLERQDEFVKVTTPQGATGWVDARYVVGEKPSVLMLEERETQLEVAVRALGAARAEVEVLRQELAERQRSAPAATSEPQEFTTSPASDSGAEAERLGIALEELDKLAEDNERLKRQISELQAKQTAMARAGVEVRADPGTPDKADNPGEGGPIHRLAGSEPWGVTMLGARNYCH